MVRLRDSWPFSLSSAPTVGNPCRPLQPESVLHRVLTEQRAGMVGAQGGTTKMVSPTTSSPASPASEVTGGHPAAPGATASVGTGGTRSRTRRRLLAIGWNLLPPLTFIAIVALWAGSVRLFGIPAYLLPGPGAVFQRLIT